MFDDSGLPAEGVAAVVVQAHADAELPAPAADIGDCPHIAFDLDVRGNVARPGEGGAFKPRLFTIVTLKVLDADGGNGDAFVLIDGHDFFPGFRLVEIGVNAADFDGIKADGAHFLGDINVGFKSAQAVALNAEGKWGTHGYMMEYY